MMEVPRIAMPDSQTWLLPMRAYLLSMRDQALPGRRSAMADSQAAFAAPAQDEHTLQLRLLQLFGDAMQPVEDVAVLADAIMNPLEGLPFYVPATIYDPPAVNAFFEQAASRDDDYLLRLAGLRFGGIDVYRMFEYRPPLEGADHSAIAAAYAATAKLLREQLAHLARAWSDWQGYFLAFKHGALVANPDQVKLVENRREIVAQMVVWRQRSKDVDIAGFHSVDQDEMAKRVVALGELALDALDYIIATRLQLVYHIRFDDDGSVALLPLRSIPWQFWMRATDVGEENLTRLRDRLHVELVSPPSV
jgi:hypothetical protein